jgi:hypothetical protein
MTLCNLVGARNIFRVEVFYRVSSWIWRQYVPPKRWYSSTSLHGDITQKTTLQNYVRVALYSCIREIVDWSFCDFTQCLRENDGTSLIVTQVLGHAIAQAVSRRLPTAVARVQSPVRPCVIWDGVNQMALGQVFSEYVCLPCQFSFHRLLHNHHHLSSGARTTRQIVADVPSRLSLTSPQEIKKIKPKFSPPHIQDCRFVSLVTVLTQQLALCPYRLY